MSSAASRSNGHGPAIALSVIVPTRDEAGNVPSLVARLDAALGAVDAEILFVDDSSDETPEVIIATASAASHPVRLIHRNESERVGGLGGAVLSGLRSARGTWAVVMDGDLQHPPEVVPDLVRTGTERSADVVVASRYLNAGSAAGLSSFARTGASKASTAVTHAVFPRRLATCTDPMSGFFALRRNSVDLDRLRPRGFKILLEILVRSSRLRVAEVPFAFQERHSGESKASFREGLLLLRKLATLRMTSLPVRRPTALGRALAFAAVGATGMAVNSIALWFLVALVGTPLLLSATLATQASTTWNYLLSDRLVFTGPKAGSQTTRFLGFALLNNAVLLLRLPVLAWLVGTVQVGYLLANLLTLLAAFAARFLLVDRLLFRPQTAGTGTSDGGAPPAQRTPVETVVDLGATGVIPRPRPPAVGLPFRYDVHGIVSIASTVALSELERFRRNADDGRADIVITHGIVNDGGLRRRALVTQYASPPAVSYQEHLGRFGCDFSVTMGPTIQVVVGPLLVRSPHVLYTNIVEALLRFVMVSRGYMLLHSACLELDGHGVMLSALTDTGKTGTILRLVRENESRFLSDDMTILSPNGVALAYPKPLTISLHTLHAVDAGDLTSSEWRRLRVQSRLHSKGGRSIGTRLGEMNLPIMSLNAVTQLVVPPPKYAIDRLVPCDHADRIQVEELFIIERGGDDLTDIAGPALLDELITNTDDAYGFPPFRYFAPALVVDGMGYEELRAEERRILRSALSHVRARRLAAPDFSWADRIPDLAREGLPLDSIRPSAFADD